MLFRQFVTANVRKYECASKEMKISSCQYTLNCICLSVTQLSWRLLYLLWLEDDNGILTIPGESQAQSIFAMWSTRVDKWALLFFVDLHQTLVQNVFLRLPRAVPVVKEKKKKSSNSTPSKCTNCICSNKMPVCIFSQMQTTSQWPLMYKMHIVQFKKKPSQSEQLHRHLYSVPCQTPCSWCDFLGSFELEKNCSSNINWYKVKRNEFLNFWIST